MNLDCETPELAEESVAEILRIDRRRLHGQLGEFKETDFEVNEDLVSDRWLPMLNAVAGRNVENIQGGQTHWFHATRAKDLNSFREGVRSLPRQLKEIWIALYPLVADLISLEQWNEFRAETEMDNYGFPEEINNAWMSNEGPYAFLFAESTLDPREIGNHDYLATSELVESISICFERKYRVNLQARHHAATRPALVKFATQGIKAAHLGAALDYLLHRSKGWSLSHLSPCFSGEGQPVSADQMIKAIPVLEGARRFGKYSTYSLSQPNFHVSLRT